MLLRNIDVGVATAMARAMVRHIRRRYITVRIACRQYSDNVLVLPRNPLSPSDAGVVSLDKL